MKSLIVIDDQKIRKEAFSRAEKILKKIDRLEANLASFHDQDQRLFASWFALTFREEQSKIAELQDEYSALARFHNQIIAYADMYDLELPEALLMLRQEEVMFRDGSPEIRAQITEARRLRDDFLEQKIREQYKNRYQSNDEDEESFEENDSEESDKAEEGWAPPLLTDEENQVMQNFREMTEQKFAQLGADKDMSFRVLALMLRLTRTNEDRKLFLKFWSFVNAKNQKAFAKQFKKQIGTSIEDYLAHIRSQTDSPNKDKLENANQDEIFDDEFIDLGARSRGQNQSFSSHYSDAELTERIKLFYRKLVRLLHPDLQTEKDGVDQWQKKIWDRVQTANERKDLYELEKLFRLVLLRNRDLNFLTIGEILESQNWLKKEFDDLSREAHGLKRLPGWNFSKRTNYEALKRKVEKPLLQQIQILSEDVAGMKAQQEYLEFMGASALRRQARGARSQGRRRRRRR